MIPLPALTVLQFWTFLQVLTRITALIAVAPIFGARQVPQQVKIGLSILIAIAITPAIQPVIGTGIPSSLYELVTDIALQALVGLLMGFVVSMILAAFQMAGTFLDQQIGFSLGQAFNPSINIVEAPIGNFQYLYAMLLFLLANGHHILLYAVTKSFAMVPISDMAINGNGMQFMSDVTSAALVNSVKIAAPTCAVLMLVDVTFALLSRAMPQMNAFFIGMPAKVIAGLIVLVIILPATALFAGQLVTGEPQMLSDLLRSLHKA